MDLDELLEQAQAHLTAELRRMPDASPAPAAPAVVIHQATNVYTAPVTIHHQTIHVAR